MLVFLWLIQFVSPVVSHYLLGKDGRTDFEGMKHACKKTNEVLPLGCQIMLGVSGKVADGVMGDAGFLAGISDKV